MKKVLFAAMFGSLLISCIKKDEIPNSPNVITATIDGTNYTINQQMSVARVRQPNDSTESFSLFGIDPTTDYMEVDVLSKNNLKDSTYKYAKDSSELIRIVFQPAGSDAFSTAYTVANPSSVTLTHVDTTSTIQGTFTAILYDNGDTTKSSKTVTNGKFVLVNQ